MPKEFLIRGSKLEDKHHVTIRGILFLEHVSLFVAQNQTKCQLCKRLVGPIIPLSWSGLVGNGFQYGCDPNHFGHGDTQPTN